MAGKKRKASEEPKQKPQRERQRQALDSSHDDTVVSKVRRRDPKLISEILSEAPKQDILEEAEKAEEEKLLKPPPFSIDELHGFSETRSEDDGYKQEEINDKAPSSKIQRRRGTGKRRIPMERIERLQARRVCFCKRRKGLFRKCEELCRLFPGYEVAAVAFSPDVGNHYAFAGPSSSASPAELFRRLLSDGMPPLPPVLSAPPADPEEAPALVSAEGTVTGVLDAVLSSDSLDDVLMQPLLMEEEMTELKAALCWADSILQVCD